jgi:TPR repeat protein
MLCVAMRSRGGLLAGAVAAAVFSRAGVAVSSEVAPEPAVVAEGPASGATSFMAEPKTKRELRALAARCDKGDAAACFEVGLDASCAEPPRLAEARRLWERACTLKHGLACNDLGVNFELGKGVPIDYPRALTLYERSCSLGNALGCRNLGAMYKFGRGVPSDPKRASEILTRACNAESGAACNDLGWMFVDSTTEAERKRHYRRACALKDRDGCANLMLDQEPGTKPEATRLRAALEGACDDGHARSCVVLGWAVHAGVGAPPKPPEAAVAYFEAACVGGSGEGCGRLAGMLTKGLGIERNRKRARALFERSCDLGWPKGCVMYGLFLAHGESGPADLARGRALIDKTCTSRKNLDVCRPEVLRLVPAATTKP